MLNIVASSVTKESVWQNNRIRQIAILLGGSVFLALSAQFSVSLFQVPLTLQTLAVLLVGAAFGPKLGAQIVLLYLFEGCCGLPVFANFSHGLAMLFGPRGGYLLGFVGAAYLTGYLLQTGGQSSGLRTLAAAVLGDIVVFACGYLVLAAFVGYRTAYWCGVAPFGLWEVAKLLIFTLMIARRSRTQAL